MTDTPARQPHRIYLAGSWKNQQEILLIRDILKAQDHDVDCFASEENGRISFNWSKLADIQEKLPMMDAKDMLAVPRVQEAFREDRKWIDWCDICILTLPSGKSSHLEAGYAKGTGKIVVIFGDLQKGDFDVMYGFADAIFRCDEIDQMIDFINGCASHSSTPAAVPDEKQYIITDYELMVAENNLFGFREKVTDWVTTIRSRPHIPAADLSHIAPNRRGCLDCLDPECPVWQTADQNCWKSQPEHDAAIRKSEREKVLDAIISGIDQMKHISFKGVRKLVESLRAQPEEH